MTLYQDKKVLVLGDDYRMVLPIARSLGRAGVEVHLAWCPEQSPACSSKYVSKRHELTWDPKNSANWTAELDCLIDKYNIEFVIPATENAVFALQHARESLTNASRCYLLDQDVFETVSNKEKTYALCEQLNVEYPKTEKLSETKDLPEIAEKLGLPLIVKPCSSVGEEQANGKNYVRVCHSYEDAKEYVNHLDKRSSRLMLQQHCQGSGVGIELLASEGEILVALQHQRLHETTGHGSTYRKTTQIDARLLAASTKIIKQLGYTGVAMVEFRVDPVSNEWKLIEINGRFWGSLPLAFAAGIDFPLNLFELFVEKKHSFRQEYKTEIRSRALTNDIRWMWRRLTGRGKQFDASQPQNLGWVANHVPLPRVITALCRGCLFLDYTDAFAWDDIQPAVSELKTLLTDAGYSIWTRFIKPWTLETEIVSKEMINAHKSESAVH